MEKCFLHPNSLLLPQTQCDGLVSQRIRLAAEPVAPNAACSPNPALPQRDPISPGRERYSCNRSVALLRPKENAGKFLLSRRTPPRVRATEPAAALRADTLLPCYASRAAQAGDTRKKSPGAVSRSDFANAYQAPIKVHRAAAPRARSLARAPMPLAAALRPKARAGTGLRTPQDGCA